MNTVTRNTGDGDLAVELVRVESELVANAADPVDAAPAAKPLMEILFERARELPTEKLREVYDEGVRLDWRATWFATTMHVLEHVLAERKHAATSEEAAA